ncbi:FAD-dependent oxidoreductase [Aspergillus lucknowensis]|uniref:FAD-binding PCMH-type domain-containing protein n=1 Tax=Aspergillus lucknowensis TaxID=176173 RepID=A0ABR4LY82_9EURO
MKSLLFLAGLATAAATSCRCFPGDACWPSVDTWNQFNRSIDGRLVATVPLGLPCHDPHYDEELCAQLREDWTLPEPHYESSSSIMAPFFANDSCDPFHAVEKPCTLGNYISYAVNISHPTHVSKALHFAQTHNIRLVIRNTGHDFNGKSTGAGALGLWTHNLKDIKIHHAYHDDDDAFYSGPAITMGAGVQGFKAYAAADDGVPGLVGGECPSVGIAGGYTQGGGHSALSSRYGLAADQALAWEVVDGQGRHIVATRGNEHADLYWALSGGGGGTYAVVLSLTAKLYPSTPVSGLNLTFSVSSANDDDDDDDDDGDDGVDREVFFEAIGLFQKVQPALVDAGAMAISTFTNSSFVLSPLTGPNIPVAELERLLEPFTTGLDDLGSVEVASVQYGGWMIPRSVVASNNDALTAAYRYIVEAGATVINVGLNVSRAVVGGDVENAVLPAWRETLIHTTLATPWVWNAPREMRESQRRMTEEFVPRLRQLAPESGAYLNEADFRQPGFQRAIYGGNYERLRAVKAVYDPADPFYGLTAVGSDEWVERADGRLCRVVAEGKDVLREL